MAEKTGIAWTDHTFNPWMGCQRVSPGCEHCYAETLTTNRMGLKLWGPASTTKRQRTKGPWVDLPRWNAAAARDGVRRRVFCASLADVFEDHPDVAPWRAEALALLERCTALDVQLLTKRPENILAMVPPSWLTAWPAHVWIGTTVEDQRRADERIPHLLAVPARVRFLSCEPLLDAVDLSHGIGEMFCMSCRAGVSALTSAEPSPNAVANWVDQECAHACPECGGETDARYPDERISWVIVGGESAHACPECGGETDARSWVIVGGESAHACPECGGETDARYPDERISWVIVGGESGPGARPFDVGWARSIVEQCREAGVAVFVKQLGARAVEEPDRPRDAPLPFRALRLRDRAGADPAEWPDDLRVQQFPGVSRG